MDHPPKPNDILSPLEETINVATTDTPATNRRQDYSKLYSACSLKRHKSIMNIKSIIETIKTVNFSQESMDIERCQENVLLDHKMH